MGFQIHEFVGLLDPVDLNEWWLQHHLPNPGCPVSFHMVKCLTWVCHKVPHSIEGVRYQSLKETLGQVRYDCFEAYILRDEPGKLLCEVPCAKFYFPYKDKSLLIPLSDDYDYLTDIQLVRMLYP